MEYETSDEVILFETKTTRKYDSLGAIARRILQNRLDTLGVTVNFDYDFSTADQSTQPNAHAEQAIYNSNPESPLQGDLLAITYINHAIIVGIKNRHKNGEPAQDPMSAKLYFDEPFEIHRGTNGSSEPWDEERGEIRGATEFMNRFYDLVALHGLEHLLYPPEESEVEETRFAPIVHVAA